MDELKADVVVIGSGGAGLRAAIAVREEGLTALLLSRCSAGLGKGEHRRSLPGGLTLQITKALRLSCNHNVFRRAR